MTSGGRSEGEGGDRAEIAELGCPLPQFDAERFNKASPRIRLSGADSAFGGTLSYKNHGPRSPATAFGSIGKNEA
jgi:hypothetical protein